LEGRDQQDQKKAGNGLLSHLGYGVALETRPQKRARASIEEQIVPMGTVKADSNIR
jgi:hypothetical protein